MKNQTRVKLLLAAPALTGALILGGVYAQDTSPPPPPTPARSNAAVLTANTALESIYEYQAFFRPLSNQPSLQVASPKTAYLWQNMSRLYRTTMILRDGEISKLPVKINPAVGALSFERKGKGKTSVDQHFTEQTMDAMIVIHKGTVVHEKYKTMRPFDKHNWFSSGKVISSTLIAMLAEENKVDSKKPVSAYLTELKGSTWDSVPVQDVLDMATGLDSTEHDEPGHDARTNPERGWFQWASSLGIFPDVKQRNLTPFEVLRHMKRIKPGQRAFEYNSINTWVLERLVERVSGKPIAELFGERVWRKIGAQADAYVAITPDGYPMTFAFVSSTLRDFARFGMVFTPSWNKISTEQIISNQLLKKIQLGGNAAIYEKGHVGKSTLDVLYDKNIKNGNQWDAVFADGDFYKEGVGGQGLYISPSRDLVVAWFCTGKNDELVLARALATASLFSN